MKPSIAFCIVVHNEDKLLERCLRSLPVLVVERYLVHDGICNDNSLAIAQKYGCKIYERPFIGIAEPHRAWLYTQVSSEWILQLDADEYLSLSLSQQLESLIQVPSIACYSFCWPYWNGKQYLTSAWPNKKSLFQKDMIEFLGFPQEEVRVTEGKIVDSSLIIEHKPDYDNYNWKTFFSKEKKWIKIHAKYYLTKPDEITRFPTSHQMLPHYPSLGSHPIISLLWIPFYHFLGIFLLGGWKAGFTGMRIAFFSGLYYAGVCWSILLIKMKVAIGEKK